MSSRAKTGLVIIAGYLVLVLCPVLNYGFFPHLGKSFVAALPSTQSASAIWFVMYVMAGFIVVLLHVVGCATPTYGVYRTLRTSGQNSRLLVLTLVANFLLSEWLFLTMASYFGAPTVIIGIG